MKKSLKITLSLVVLSFLIFSFTPKSSADFVGVYGDEMIELKINKDFTFSYKNVFTIKDKEVTGYWKSQNGKIILSSLKRTNSLPKKWKFKRDGKSIKTRKGLTFLHVTKELRLINLSYTIDHYISNRLVA